MSQTPWWGLEPPDQPPEDYYDDLEEKGLQEAWEDSIYERYEDSFYDEEEPEGWEP